MTLVAGVDSSTQACLIVLRDADDGRVVAEAEASHPPAHPPASEQWPEDWWSALCAAAHQLDLCDVAAVSIGGQGHGLVALDASGKAVRPAKLWNDTTASDEARELVGLLGAEAWARRTGIVPTSAITVAKLLWLAREGRVQEGTDFRSFVMTVARHTCTDLYRRERLRGGVEAPESPAEPPDPRGESPEERLEQEERREILKYIVQGLGEDCRQLWSWIYRDGLAHLLAALRAEPRENRLHEWSTALTAQSVRR